MAGRAGRALVPCERQGGASLWADVAVLFCLFVSSSEGMDGSGKLNRPVVLRTVRWVGV